MASLKEFILSYPSIYSLYRNAVFSAASQRDIVARYIQPREGESVFDIGCGPGDLLEFLPPSVKYIGFDAESKYIESAKARYGTRGEFFCGRVNSESLKELPSFDIVMAFGIIHHLDDAEAEWLFKLADSALKPGGRLVTYDNCYTENQSAIAKYIISKDRGRHVRTVDGYEKLAGKVFPSVKSHIRHDLLRIPYTVIIMECVK